LINALFVVAAALFVTDLITFRSWLLTLGTLNRFGFGETLTFRTMEPMPVCERHPASLYPSVLKESAVQMVLDLADPEGTMSRGVAPRVGHQLGVGVESRGVGSVDRPCAPRR
jgi:hypothetical protein